MSVRKNGRGRPINIITPGKLTACYCDGKRDLTAMELFCNKCNTWFHGPCLKDLKNFFGLKFMVCYTFHCQNCSPSKSETWVAKQANFGHMLITALANLQYEKEGTSGKTAMFSLKSVIIPYFEKNWESLTSMKRRDKPTWHQALRRAMLRDPDIFLSQIDENSEDNEDADGLFGLNEGDLTKIGPCHDFIRIMGKRAAPGASAREESVTSDDGPKTRGAKRKAERQDPTMSSVGKRTKLGRLAIMVAFSLLSWKRAKISSNMSTIHQGTAARPFP